MHLLSRLQRLEARMPRPAMVPTSKPRCAECGGNADGTHRAGRDFTTVFEDDQMPENDFCKACGTRLVYRIEFDQGG